jgi:hypothetical protein
MAAGRKALVTALPLLLILITAIAVGNLIYNLRNLDTGEEYIPYIPARQEEGEPAIVDFGITGPMTTAFLRGMMVAVVAIVAIAFVIARRKGERLRDLVPVWETVGILLGGAVLIVLFLSWGDILAAVRGLLQFPSGTPPPGEGGPGGQVPSVASYPVGMVITIIAALVVLVFAVVYHLYPAVHHHATYGEPERERKRLETLEVVRRSIQNLEEGGDPRLVILQCYSTMCGLIERSGLSRGEFLTPREFQLRAWKELHLSQDSLGDMTHLFEEARYSTHRMGPPEADRALKGLRTIRAELEAQHGPA